MHAARQQVAARLRAAEVHHPGGNHAAGRRRAGGFGAEADGRAEHVGVEVQAGVLRGPQRVAARHGQCSQQRIREGAPGKGADPQVADRSLHPQAAHHRREKLKVVAGAEIADDQPLPVRAVISEGGAAKQQRRLPARPVKRRQEIEAPVADAPRRMQAEAVIKRVRIDVGVSHVVGLIDLPGGVRRALPHGLIGGRAAMDANRLARIFDDDRHVEQRRDDFERQHQLFAIEREDDFCR